MFGGGALPAHEGAQEAAPATRGLGINGSGARRIGGYVQTGNACSGGEGALGQGGGSRGSVAGEGHLPNVEASLRITSQMQT